MSRSTPSSVHPRDSRKRLSPIPGYEPIDGYRLIELLGRGGCGEVWKCEAPGGLHKAIKFVSGNLVDDERIIEQELGALERIKSIRHPFLLSMDRIEMVNDALVIVMELADKSLHDLLKEYQSVGLRGIPRHDLLRYFAEAAETLDLMSFQHGLQHLDIKPRNLFLLNNHVKVADFGVVHHFNRSTSPDQAFQTATTPPGGTMRYCPPEVLQGKVSARSDQYSLAIAYQELLTGTLPFQGKNSRQLLMQHLGDEPNISALPPGDQAILKRALAKEPRQRYRSCSELVKMLWDISAETPAQGAGDTKRMQTQTPLLDVTLLHSDRFFTPDDVATISFRAEKRKNDERIQTVKAVVAKIVEYEQTRNHENLQALAQNGEILEDSFTARLDSFLDVPGLESFVERWSAHVVSQQTQLILQQCSEPAELKEQGPQVFFLGRKESCHLPIPRDDVHELHCLLTPNTEGVMLQDLGGPTGTIINGQRVKSCIVNHSDRLVVGSITLNVQVLTTPPANESKTHTTTGVAPHYRMHAETVATLYAADRASLWDRWRGNSNGLRVTVRMLQPADPQIRQVSVALAVQPIATSPKIAKRLLTERGIAMIHELRSAIQANCDDRKMKRWPFPQSINVIQENQRRSIACQGKDISVNGIGFYVPDDPQVGQVVVELPTDWKSGQDSESVDKIMIPAQIVRVRPISSGWYEVGARFN